MTIPAKELIRRIEKAPHKTLQDVCNLVDLLLSEAGYFLENHAKSIKI